MTELVHLQPGARLAPQGLSSTPISFREKTHALGSVQTVHVGLTSTQGDEQKRVQGHYPEKEITVPLSRLQTPFNNLTLPLRLLPLQTPFNNLTLPLRLLLPTFTDKETEAQKTEVTCTALGQVNGITAQTGLKAGLPEAGSA